MTEVARHGVIATTEASDIYDILAADDRLFGYTTLDSKLTGAQLDEPSRFFNGSEREYETKASPPGSRWLNSRSLKVA